MKDWIGNKNSIYKTLGATSHTDKEREENDYYATDPKALELFLNKAKELNIDFGSNIWECAVGEGHLAELLKSKGYNVFSSDIVDRNYTDTQIIDFLTFEGKNLDTSIITNPPYKYAKEFVEKALSVISDKRYVAMILKVQFLEGKARKQLFEKHPPKYICVHSERQLCAKNADFDGMKESGGSAVAYAWFVWEKGYTDDTIVKWI